MKSRLISMLLISCAVGIALAVSGCCVCWWWGQEQYERTDNLSAPMTGVERIDVDTSFGDVEIIGADTSDCNVTASITGQAPTEKEARQLVEQTNIKLEITGSTLVIRVEKPRLRRNRSIGISYDIVVPKQTAIKCRTSYGYIKLENIEGDVESNTSYGDVIADNIAGVVELETSYGDVDCKSINSSDFTAKSSFGDIKVAFSDSSPANLNAGIKTSYGDIVMDIPSNFAGDIAVETSFGKIKTELPLNVKGEISRNRLKGTVGQPALSAPSAAEGSGAEGGGGELDLKTSFGDVTIK